VRPVKYAGQGTDYNWVDFVGGVGIQADIRSRWCYALTTQMHEGVAAIHEVPTDIIVEKERCAF
jgi:hydroxymethylpyrimidine/phosphomethylpyrimidine kinase